MRYKIVFVLFAIAIVNSSSKNSDDEFWGFFGHRLINKTAVFTLPVDLVPLYKSNIDFITEHSVDPDKRRYSSPLEAVRHYIDLDIFGTYPFDNVPRQFPEALAVFGEAHIVTRVERDTVVSWERDVLWSEVFDDSKKEQWSQEIKGKTYKLLDDGFLYMPKSWIPKEYRKSNHELVFTERLTEYGMLPYHLSLYQGRLTKAFKEKNWPIVIRLSTEIGHYLSDAHVPLHTTENYNGQLTGQDGIHAFWESRIPELFATDNYDFFVGRATYIEDTDDFFWDVILESHSHVAEVLSKELEIRNSFDKDKQYCFEERGANTTRLECRAYAEAYQDAMAGMVEDRMRKSIQALGSVWYTAWVDGGSPDVRAHLSELSVDTTQVLQSDSLAIQAPTSNQ